MGHCVRRNGLGIEFRRSRHAAVLGGRYRSTVLPGLHFFSSYWYTRKELPSRIAIFYSGYTPSSAFGGLIVAGIVSGMEGLGGYPSWRWVRTPQFQLIILFETDVL